MPSSRRAGQRFDAVHKVTTEALLFLGELDPEAIGSAIEHATHYQATPPDEFAELAAAIPIPLENATFVDLGSGMGRVVLLAAQHPFRQVVGVEVSGALHEVARDNLRAFDHARLRCRDVRLVNRDALDYRFPPGNLVVYFFNPFDAYVMEDVVARLATGGGKREVVLLYHTPVQRATIEASKAFDTVADVRAGAVFRRMATAR